MDSLESRMTEVEVALSYDRNTIEELSQALFEANQEIAALKKRLERLERSLDQVSGQIEGPPANERPPHY